MGLWRSLQKRWRRATSPAHVKRHLAEHDRWIADGGEQRRYQFPDLGPESVVLDLGGYKGEWALGISERYGSRVHIFEPHPRFAAELATNLSHNPQLFVHPFALSSRDGTFMISDKADAARASVTGELQCQSVEATAYLASLGIRRIDLMKVNIEGGEYDILPHLISTGLIADIGTIQVQFHRYAEGDEARREQIVQQLRQTHIRTWCYDFVWEDWKRIPAQHEMVGPGI